MTIAESNGEQTRNVILDPYGWRATTQAMVDETGEFISGSNPLPVSSSAAIDASNNSTTTPLAADAVFTGTWLDVGGQTDVVVAVSTDADGFYSIQFSPDGVNQDSTLTRYYRTERINAPHRFTITRKYMRVVFTNGSDAQTYLRLQTVVGISSDLNAPTDGTLAQDFDAIVVRPTEASDEILLGKRQGITTWTKFGYNQDIDTAAMETIWEPGGNPTFLTTASTFRITSSSANDASGGTGARTLMIRYIDSNRKAATVTVTLNGTSNVDTVVAGLGINRVGIETAGSGQVNAGKITITAVTGGSIQATMPAGEGTTQQPIFFTQAGHRALATDLIINTYRQSGQDPKVQVTGWVLNFVKNAKSIFFSHTIDTSVETTFIGRPDNKFIIPEQSVVYYTAETDKDNTLINLKFSLQEHRDAST